MAGVVHLLNAREDEKVPTILRGLVGLFDSVMPGRLRALYQLGSRSDRTAVSVSDIDGVLVFEPFEDEACRRRAHEIVGHCQRLCPLRLDLQIVALDDPAFLAPADVRLKLGGRLFHGEDVRDRIALPPIDAYRREIVKWPEEFIAVLHDRQGLPPAGQRLEPPDPADEFQGYTRKRAVRWYPPDVESGTKELVATICWTATAILALEKGLYVATRGDCVRLYAEHMRDGFEELVPRAYRRCKLDWSYAVPEDKASRAELSEICRESLAYFDHYCESRHPREDRGQRVSAPRLGEEEP